MGSPRNSNINSSKTWSTYLETTSSEAFWGWKSRGASWRKATIWISGAAHKRENPSIQGETWGWICVEKGKTSSEPPPFSCFLFAATDEERRKCLLHGILLYISGRVGEEETGQLIPDPTRWPVLLISIALLGKGDSFSLCFVQFRQETRHDILFEYG